MTDRKPEYTETLYKLYLELAHVVPESCITYREIKLKKAVDRYGLALMMIREGAADPEAIARKAIDDVAAND